MNKPLIVSVVRDMTMYNRCIGLNSFSSGCELCVLDNRTNNEWITVLYNRVLEAFDYAKPRWLVFCHEDFAPREDLVNVLSKLDTRFIYGPIGGLLECQAGWLLGGHWRWILRGSVIESNKDGSQEMLIGNPVETGFVVETIDCQCVIVHSDLVKKSRLRFDERLSYDLYAEDFCLAARMNHSVQTAIVALKCQHYSRGNIQSRFYAQKSYLDDKYPKEEAFGICGHNIGGGRTLMRRVQKKIYKDLASHVPRVANRFLWITG